MWPGHTAGMRNHKQNGPAASKLHLLRQIGNLIPAFLVPKLARETGVDKQIRTFSAWSHVVSLRFAPLTPSIGLNDVRDALGLHSGPLAGIRGAPAPTRNNLSHANKVRSAAMAGKLFWAVFEHWGKLSPGFVRGRAGKRLARKFQRAIPLADPTTIPLIASCPDWARHRRRKAAAKCHLRLETCRVFCRALPVSTPPDTTTPSAPGNGAPPSRQAKSSSVTRLTVDFAHLAALCLRLVFGGTRAQDNLRFKVVRRYPRGALGKIRRDDPIGLTPPASRQDFPDLMRRIVALVAGEGREGARVFLSNNLDWSAASIADLYRCRWPIEVFCKQIKQPLPLAAFLGTSANAGRWQVWTALLVYRLLRYLAFVAQWAHSFSRRFTRLRAALWKKWDALDLLRR